MTRLGQAASFESVESMVKEVDGINVTLATPRALFELKRDTVRPLDQPRRRSLAAEVRPGGRLMAVEKYRSIEEMNAAPVRAGSGDGFERFVRHCARFRKLDRQEVRSRSGEVQVVRRGAGDSGSDLGRLRTCRTPAPRKTGGAAAPPSKNRYR